MTQAERTRRKRSSTKHLRRFSPTRPTWFPNPFRKTVVDIPPNKFWPPFFAPSACKETWRVIKTTFYKRRSGVRRRCPTYLRRQHDHPSTRSKYRLKRNMSELSSMKQSQQKEEELTFVGSWQKATRGSKRLDRAAMTAIAVDSPPGITRASQVSRSSFVRTVTILRSLCGNRSRSRRTICSRKAPCRPTIEPIQAVCSGEINSKAKRNPLTEDANEIRLRIHLGKGVLDQPVKIEIKRVCFFRCSPPSTPNHSLAHRQPCLWACILL